MAIGTIIPMSPRNSMAEQIAVGASKCLHKACKCNFESVQMGEVAEVVSGGTPSTMNPDFWGGNIVWLTPKDLGKPHDIEISSSERMITEEAIRSSSTRLLPPDTVLLSSRAPIGYLGIAAVPLCTNQGFKNIICSDKLSSRYLFHMLRASVEDLQSRGRGNTFKEITAKIVKTFKIPLPPYQIQIRIASFLDSLYLRLSGQNIELPDLPHPLEDQKRIVAKIETLMTRIEETRKTKVDAIEECKELSFSLLEKIFSNESLMKTTKRVKEICTKPQYGYTDSAKYEPVGPKFLRITDIQEGQANWEQVPYSSCPEKEKYLLESGDILFARSGATTGKTYLVESSPESIFASYLIRIRPRKGVLAKYLYWFFQSPLYWLQVIEKIKVSAQPNMNGKKLSNIQIPLPGSEETQRRIVTYLDSFQEKVDELKKLQDKVEHEMEELIPSILDKAFNGEL